MDAAHHSVTLGPGLNDKGVTLYVNFSKTLYVHVKSSDIQEFLYDHRNDSFSFLR